MKQTKIDWCDSTLNPVVGCKHNCKYCYARRQNNRFHWIKKWDEPEFFPKRLKQLKSKKPKSVFMDSMSDLAFYEKDWAEVVYNAMAQNPQHRYLFLTKDYQQAYNTFYSFYDASRSWDTPLPRIWIGESFCGGKYEKHVIVHSPEWKDIKTPDFLSVEPLLASVDLLDFINYNNWESNNNGKDKVVIIGAETGNRKGKVIPQKEWVDDIVRQCDTIGVRVFMKESLRKIMGDDFRQDKLPWGIER